jgi:hypothetical protein
MLCPPYRIGSPSVGRSDAIPGRWRTWLLSEEARSSEQCGQCQAVSQPTGHSVARSRDEVCSRAPDEHENDLLVEHRSLTDVRGRKLRQAKRSIQPF